MEIVKELFRKLLRVFLKLFLVVFLLMLPFLIYIGWCLSPMGYISNTIGFYPVSAFPLASYDYDPNSFREVDTLNIYRLSTIDRHRFEDFIKARSEWLALPLNTIAENAPQIKRKKDEEAIRKMLGVQQGFWYYDGYRTLSIYDSNQGILYLFYSTKV